MPEVWKDLEDFPDYAVSNTGLIINKVRDSIKIPSPNQQNIMMVNLSLSGRQNVRSVAPLIAEAFLEKDPNRPHFDTPIHLNGDKADCRVDNLAWRPRWFAVMYHKQFHPEERRLRHGFLTPVMINETEESYPTSWEAAIQYGMLDREIFIATLNRTYVFPHNFTFSEV